MNRKLIRIFIVALTVNLVVSKSISSDDAEIGVRDEKSIEGLAEDFKAVLYEQMQYIQGKLREFKANADPKFQEFAEKAEPIANSYFRYVFDKLEQIIDAGESALNAAKPIANSYF